MEGACAESLETCTFYGQSRLSDAERRVKLLRRERELKQNVLLPHYRLRFDSPSGASGTWRVFHRQKDALDFARVQLSQDIHVFAYESESFTSHNGQRLYLVCSYEHFWHYYSRLPLKQRHHYEVIPEDTVCKLYFDLEFEYKVNENKNGARMTEIYMKYVCAWLRHIYGINCAVENILLFDASTDQKFSQHAIFHIPGAAFRNNTAVGCFVRHIHFKLLSFVGQKTLALTERSVQNDEHDSSEFSRKDTNCGISAGEIDMLNAAGLSPDDLASLVVNHRNGSTTYFYDLGVYSRNRNFRLMGSTKLKKENGELVVAGGNRFRILSPRKTQCDGQMYLKNEQLFYDSIVCNVRFSDEIRILDFDEMPGLSNHNHITGRSLASSSATDRAEGYDKSPYPAVDEFVTSFVQSYGSNAGVGRIWRWAYFNKAGGVLLYDIIRNRWCANVGREHRSNNIFIVVDLGRRVFYQKCHDPDCRAANFKSQDYQLPAHLHVNEDDCQTMDFDDVADDELMEAVSTLEDSLVDCSTSIGDETSDDELVRAAILAENDDVILSNC